MNVSDDSDEDIFDATSRPALACDSISKLVQCSEDETSCEMLQLLGPQNGETCPVNCPMDSVLPACNPAAIRRTNCDSGFKSDLDNTHMNQTVASAHSGSVECESPVDVDSSIPSVHCDLTVTAAADCILTADTCQPNVFTTEVIGHNQTAERTDSCMSVNSTELDDELLVELENEFHCSTSVPINSSSSDNADRPLSSQADSLSDDDLTLKFVSLQRRQQALECRLQNTLEARKQMEIEYCRLECKLNASLEALEAAKQQMEAAKLEVCCILLIVV